MKYRQILLLMLLLPFSAFSAQTNDVFFSGLAKVLTESEHYARFKDEPFADLLPGPTEEEKRKDPRTRYYLALYNAPWRMGDTITIWIDKKTQKMTNWRGGLKLTAEDVDLPVNVFKKNVRRGRKFCKVTVRVRALHPKSGEPRSIVLTDLKWIDTKTAPTSASTATNQSAPLRVTD